MITQIMHPVKKELKRENCGWDHLPPDDFVKSQWQNCTKSCGYLLYRWLIAIFFTSAVIVSMFDAYDGEGTFWLYFIYMTNWGILMCMLTNILGAVLVTVWHYHPVYAGKMLSMESLTSPFRLYWGMHIITLVLSIVISVIYWSILYNAEEANLSATNMLTHACNSICMFIDLLIVAHPLRLLHMFLPVLFGLVYAIFSAIYQLSGGHNKKGMPYIYHVIDWSQPTNASATVVGVLLLTCCVYMVLFSIYKLRLRLYMHINHASFFLPTTTPQGLAVNGKVTAPSVKGSGIQHSPSGISMVFGSCEGLHNAAFSQSSEKVP